MIQKEKREICEKWWVGEFDLTEYKIIFSLFDFIDC